MGYGYYFASTVFVVIFGAISWLLIDRLHLSGYAQTIVYTLLLAVSFAMFGLFQTIRTRRERKKQAAQAGQASAGVNPDEEISFLLKTAESKLAASQLGREGKLSGLPVYFLVGETGSAKSSVFVQSSQEPELLAGQVYQEAAVIPTRPANFWLAKKSVFVEAGGRLLSEPDRWRVLIKRLRPAKLGSFFWKKQQAPRGAVVCVDAEMFLKPGAEEALLLTARNLHTRIGEISQELGVPIPVYVLFTKMDRVRCFLEYSANLTDQEVHQVLGATLPLPLDTREGVYAEEAARQLTTSFNNLVYSLSDKRTTFLLRERDEKQLPAIYEFPREFRKLREPLVRFLVALGRPSQLRVSPFLRGFYFSGVRPQIVKEAAPAVRANQQASETERREATGMFSLLGERITSEPAPTPAGRMRRVPQWLFLGHLFDRVILQDRAGMGASGSSARAELVRRLLLTAGCLLLLTWSVGMTVSFFRNRALEASVRDAARGISSAESGGAAQQLPSRDALQRLDTLRQAVQQLSEYSRNGAPWSLRWGLYVGNDIYPTAREIYFSRFHQIMFGATQDALLQWLRRLPVKPGPDDPYQPSYDTLKAYLITTSFSEKSSKTFLSPLLLERWLAKRDIDPDRRTLARNQFDFYSEELKLDNPFSKENDGQAIERSRYYLSQFNAAESIYLFMISEANRTKPSVNFNRQFPGSAAYVTSNRDVTGAFTNEGWAFMQQAIGNVKSFFGGEQWVLGDRSFANLDPSKLEPELRARYRKDFIANWRAYLASSNVVGYASIPDAARKLEQLSGNQSFLLGLFCLATNHTSVADDEVKGPYQPVHFVEPPNCSAKYVNDANKEYLNALVGLQTSLDRLAKAGGTPDESAVQQTLSDVTNAYRVTRQIAQSFRIDREGNVHGMVQKLMEEPIRSAEAMLGQLGPAQLNSSGSRFCGPFSSLTSKYPFNTSSKVDASLEEINDIFRPGDGRLATFYQQSLKEYLDRSGTVYVRKPDSRVRITDAFLQFFNRATALSEALYKGESKEPKLVYSMTSLPSEGLRGITLRLDGQILRSTARINQSMDFTWPGGATRGALLAGNMGGSDLSFITYEGLWAAFRFFGDADRFQSAGNVYNLQWVPRQGQSGQPIRLDNNKTLSLPFNLDMKGAPPIFQKGYLNGFQCVSNVAR
ncbi:MAG: ImcF-related family protein [Acidobacteriota bacterium]